LTASLSGVHLALAPARTGEKVGCLHWGVGVRWQGLSANKAVRVWLF
jgi:hypothetical protein